MVVHAHLLDLLDRLLDGEVSQLLVQFFDIVEEGEEEGVEVLVAVVALEVQLLLVVLHLNSDVEVLSIAAFDNHVLVLVHALDPVADWRSREV